MTQPVSRTARQARILELLEHTRVSSQVQLSELLLDEGIDGSLGPMDGPAIARMEERLGTGIGASASLDRTRFSLNALTPNLAGAT